jgi:hypothetical protein
MFRLKLSKERTELFSLEFMGDRLRDKPRQSSGANSASQGGCQGARDAHGDLGDCLGHAQFIP